MSDQTRELIEFNKTIEHFHIIRSNEFPDLDLYMDQVLAYLSRQLSVFKIDPEDNIITSSMINNYVKFGIVPPPRKRCAPAVWWANRWRRFRWTATTPTSR